jgi:CRISPR-associated protein Cas1
MLYEGRIANRYFSTITRIINKLRPDFNFTGRGTKTYSWNMNASDPVNALLNYGYAIVEAEACRAINSAGLDPYVVYLHELAGSKQPLVYDVQELYRWLVDLSIIQLLEDHKLTKSAFVTTENYHTRLRESTAKLLVDYIRNNFNTAVTYKEKQYTYQYVLSNNVQTLANYVVDKQKVLHFSVPGVPIKRNDDTATRAYILNMTSEQRKELGINKSTLWYIQRNLREGKKVKLYHKVKAKFA